jgi:hypothetical protein
MEEELILIDKMKKNDYFIRKNYSKFQERYGSEFIAVDKGKIIGHNTKLIALRTYLEARKIDITTVLIQFIPKKGIEILF